MNRKSMIEAIRLQGSTPWDVLIIGGGATGLGAAVEAASRGYKTIVVEQCDFAKGTSSRSTKLVHGGVRYLQQGNIKLVMEALHERGLLYKNAPHLVHNQSFIIPTYSWWKGIYYTIGLKLYDMLAGKLSLGESTLISRDETLAALSNLKGTYLRGGVKYFDGQFDDARLAINLATTAAEQGATVINYMRVSSLMKDSQSKLTGVLAHDEESSTMYKLYAKSVINCTGVFADNILQLDNPSAAATIVPSQGVHIVLDREFLPGTTALMIPKTSDGRVLFAVPWHSKIVVGTTDTLIGKGSLEPEALAAEVDFILNTTGEYLVRKPERSDIRSVFAGLRPLVAAVGGMRTKDISRSHKIIHSESGLITVIGGKWTTYRKMGEDTIDYAIALARLTNRPSVSRNLMIHGGEGQTYSTGTLSFYGSDKQAIEQLISQHAAWGEKLHPSMDTLLAEVIWSARHEMARTVEDILARRTRMLFLNAKASIESAPTVSRLLAEELGYDEAWQHEQVITFTALAKRYVL